MKNEALLSIPWYPLGDSAIVLQFGEGISREVHQRIKTFADALEQHPFPGMIELVPAFTTLTIYFDPWMVSEKGKINPFTKLEEWLQPVTQQSKEQEDALTNIVEIPVCYGGDMGPDLDFVARHNQLTPEEVISIHAAGEYLVYMIGFAPGFPYLGGMNEKIAAPRKEQPRLAIPEGSVGIAGMQTGIYPITTPGGWQLIGRTPLTLFDSHRQSPSLLRMGDIIRFVPISLEEFRHQKNLKLEDES